MTREEAIRRFQRMKNILSIPNSDASRAIEAIDMAIEALSEPEKEDDVLLVDAVKRAYEEGRDAEGKLLDEVVEKAEREKEELDKECSLLRWKYANAMRIIKDLEQRIGEGK